jgi:hypothetical protein
MTPSGTSTDGRVSGSPSIVRSAEELAEIAVAQPTNPVPLYLLSHVLRRRRDPSWMDVMSSALARPHITPQQLYMRALNKIMLGDWSGWSDYSARMRNPDTVRDLSLYTEICWRRREWDGEEDLTNQSLVVLTEQGLGDCLQMWRFVPALMERVGTVILMAYPPLVSLARCNFGPQAKVWLYHVKPTSLFDRYVWGFSLPGIFGSLPEFKPLTGPGRRRKLPERTKPLRAGLCWAGSTSYPHDGERSMPIERIGPLLSRSEVEWHNLQVGPRASDAQAYPEVQPADPPLVSFTDTADFMSQLDYVVTVDTSVAHLAGLLGIPTYLLLQHDSHWRWGLEETIPWYPSMRLIRQRAFGDWASAVNELVAILDECANVSSSIMSCATT